MPTEIDVLHALALVRDPELDEPITTLGFVDSVAIDGATVAVDLRLPTFYCAPNFSYLMAVDARRALAELPGVTAVRVHILDHHAGDQLNRGLDEGQDFAGIFPGETDGDDLRGLRAIFRGKAFYARTDEVCRQLLAQGRRARELVDVRLTDLPVSAVTSAYLQRRAEAGLDTTPDAPLLVALDGRKIGPEEADLYLARARTFATSLESNGGFCRSLLHARYGSTTGRQM